MSRTYPPCVQDALREILAARHVDAATCDIGPLVADLAQYVECCIEDAIESMDIDAGEVSDDLRRAEAEAVDRLEARLAGAKGCNLV